MGFQAMRKYNNHAARTIDRRLPAITKFSIIQQSDCAVMRLMYPTTEPSPESGSRQNIWRNWKVNQPGRSKIWCWRGRRVGYDHPYYCSSHFPGVYPSDESAGHVTDKLVTWHIPN
ncbi:hypothetical protein T265_01053 [Opisthorchis viverrini]|uniref:Uncharacterized protein n=1 Tax=Opisthorchis viverrini TaxID=6198 RepID=A0A075A0S1_OPIVI|nr:hypothetical protein T265_01053 [Opisthorchis viverrini]KER32961.1 hypothetical protein T265_01053 [Opisthorchis viverrini]